LLTHLELLLFGEGDGIDPLKGLGLCVALPVGGRALVDPKGLDLARVTDVRAVAKVNQGTAAVHGGGLFLDALRDEALLERIVLGRGTRKKSTDEF
jgi:hypothetical protein